METKARWRLVRVLLTTLNLFLGWMLFTWSLELYSLLLGAGFSITIALMTYPIFIEEQEADRRSHVPRIHLFPIFFGILAFNMYVASFNVLGQIVRGRVNPGVVHFRTRLRSDLARVALTNSITLTPGTITIGLEDDHLIVHWLGARTTHSRYAHRLIAGVYEKLLGRIWN